MREDHWGCVEGVEKDERGPPGGVWKEVLLLQTSSSLLSAGLP